MSTASWDHVLFSEHIGKHILSYIEHTSKLSQVSKAAYNYCSFINNERGGKCTCCTVYNSFVRPYNKVARISSNALIGRNLGSDLSDIPTSKSNISFWRWIADNEWVTGAASSEGLFVIDIGSGINSICVFGSVVSELNIRMAIGIDGDSQKVLSAAETALR